MTSTLRRSPLHTREQRRSEIGHRLLDDLESLVRRHRGLSTAPDEEGLHAELIAAEAAQILAAARRALERTPRVGPPGVGGGGPGARTDGGTR